MTARPLPPTSETTPRGECRCTGRELANGHRVRCPQSTREPYLVELPEREDDRRGRRR
ncbi:hypothetical protein [Pseudonocardia acaciae]|uniref:hypothetical protein n=1 Tax=Pseudonocardia acaciae TaxID=551276 RepID=UPI000ACC2900|nr:hypothetical protein [Pseudonocardia acaciae]